MAGVLIGSIGSGQIITRTGRYKVFPILGTAVAAIGMYLLSSLDATTPTGVAALHMLVLGLGLGMVMQVLVLATQNAVPYDQLGVATSGATLFRSIGGSLGTAVLGAIFTARLTKEEHEGKGQVIAFTDSLHVVFEVAAVVVLVAFVLAWFIKEMPLRKTVETSVRVGEALGAPVDTDSLREVTRGLVRLVGRERTLVFIEGATRRAGIDLSPSVAWLLLRAGAPDAPGDLTDLRELPHVHPERFDAALVELRQRGHLDGVLTPTGVATRDQLVAARTDCLRSLVDDWEPDRHPELDPLLRRLAEELDRPPRAATREPSAV
jgi:MFS family permease